MPPSHALHEHLRENALERLRAAAAEAEGRIAAGPHSGGSTAAAVAPSATQCRERSRSPPARAVPRRGESERGSALQRLRMAMAEAEAKLQANGSRQGFSAVPAAPTAAPSPPRAPSPGASADALDVPPPDESESETEEEAGAGSRPTALARFRAASDAADAAISDTAGKHWMGAHVPDWSTERAFAPRADAHAALRARLVPLPKRTTPWPLTAALDAAAGAAAAEAGATLRASLRATGTLHKWVDAGERLALRFHSPQPLRPQPWLRLRRLLRSSIPIMRLRILRL